MLSSARAAPPRPHGAAALLVALSALAFGCGERGNRGDATAPGAGDAKVLPPGFWFAAREVPGVDLGHLGYAAGTRGSDEAVAVGAQILDAARRAPGVDLYCSGHAPEARLVDADGVLLHRWAFDYEAATGLPPMRHPTQRAWRRVRLLPDGGLLALHEGLALLRLDADSRLVWALGEGAHHDFDVAADGTVHVLVRRAVELPAIGGGRTLVDDGVARVSPTGELLGRVSLLEALARSRWAHALDDAAAAPEGRTIDAGDGPARDLMHVNSYALLAEVPAGLPAAFQPGRALVCLRELDAVAVFDPATGEFVWFLQPGLDGPHDPELDAEGRLWVFDNGLRRGASRAVALDVRTGQVVRQWPERPGPGFHSEVCGALQLLPNGNLLLTESTAGRAVEVAPDGAVVWRFGTPHRVAGPDGPLIACLFELERLPLAAAAFVR